MKVDNEMNLPAHRQLPPSAQDAALARTSSQLLSRYAKRKRPLTVRVKDPGRECPHELPAGAVVLLIDILDAMATGRGVMILPENAELTTVQAASVLNVSRPYLIKLLSDGLIPHRKVGKHRRVRIEDVMAYKSAVDQDRQRVLDQLAHEAQNEDTGYARR